MSSLSAAQVSGSGARAAVSDLLGEHRPIRPTGKAAHVLARFGAQIGEFGWHSIHVDETLDTVSAQHANSIGTIIHRMGFSNPRILEMGAYAHYSSQLAAHLAGGTSVSHDISAASLRVGQGRAKALGLGAEHVCVAGDFHNLPFADNAFDITFIASAIHHTRTPWKVLQEMVRVTRPGGVIHLENEPVSRVSCFYQFRCNRDDSRTPFEQEVERLGLTRTLSSPYPGSRSEELFGMVENDAIDLEIYEENLLSAGHPLQWLLDSYSCMGQFETWVLSNPTSAAIAARLTADLEQASKYFSDRDRASGFSIPNDDQIWALAYRIERAMTDRASDPQSVQRHNARLFGAALKATIIKSGVGQTGPLFSRQLENVDDVLLDDAELRAVGLDLRNVLASPEKGEFGPDWTVITEANGYNSLANNGARAELKLDVSSDGVLVMRTYSIALSHPYFFSVIVGDTLAYRHCVTAGESHLAKVFVPLGEKIVVCLHDDAGEPIDEAPLLSRMIPSFVPVVSVEHVSEP